MQAFQKEKEIIAIHIPSKGTFCCFKPHKWLKGIKLWAVTEIGALSMEISEQTWSRTQLHNSYLAVYTFLWSKPNSDEKKSLKRFLSPHAPLHVYTVQITVQPHISKNTAKPSVILHFFVHSHCHARILNTTVKNTTKANSLNPEKPSFWLTMMKSSFTIDSLKVSHLHISRVCNRRQERTAGSSGLVRHSWMETT